MVYSWVIAVRYLTTILFLSVVVSSSHASCPAVKYPALTSKQSTDYMLSKGTFSLNKDGVVVFDYGNRYGGLGKWENPYFVSNFANSYYWEYFQSGCKDALFLEKFIIQAKHLLNSAEMIGEVALWRYPFDNDAYGLKKGWISGIGQSRIAGVLYRAAIVTGDERYKKTADSAMKVYLKALREGGVVTVEEGVTWIEEAPDPGGNSYKVLNGHITAVAGLVDIYEITKDQVWKDLYEQGIEAVRRDLPKFDAGITSRYSLGYYQRPHLAERGGYNVGHIDQLLWLYEFTGDRYFYDWASRFQAYEDVSWLSFSAEGTDTPTKYSPKFLDASYKGAWVRSKVPTWIGVELSKPTVISGFVIDATIPARSPRDFSISIQDGGEWKEVFRVQENAEPLMEIKFSQPVMARAVRVDITKLGSDGFVSIKAAMPVPLEPRRQTPIGGSTVK